jgi:hypothetical protein
LQNKVGLILPANRKPQGLSITIRLHCWSSNPWFPQKLQTTSSSKVQAIDCVGVEAKAKEV